MNLYKSIQLPGLTVPGNLFLAPMAGYTDRAFREICLSRGADFTFTEMISCEGLCRDNKKTLDLLERGGREVFWGIQIFGSDPETLPGALKRILPHKPVLLDLNCGCPVPKVTNTGAGAALMKNPGKIYALIKTLVKEIENCGVILPVTAKIRSGWDENFLSYIEAGKAAEEAGAAMVTLHPRTRSQIYSGRSRWEHLKRLAECLTIPVLGSGDLFSAEDAERMLEETGCRGVMFARGAVGNPGIFASARKLLTKGEKEGSQDYFLRLSDAKEHLSLAALYLGEKKACKEMRKHFCAYSKGIPGSSSFRNRIVQAETLRDYETALTEMLFYLEAQHP